MGIHEAFPTRTETEEYGGTKFNIDQALGKLRDRNFGAALAYLIELDNAENLIRDLQRTLDFDDRKLSGDISEWWAGETGKKRWLEERLKRRTRSDTQAALNSPY